MPSVNQKARDRLQTGHGQARVLIIQLLVQQNSNPFSIFSGFTSLDFIGVYSGLQVRREHVVPYLDVNCSSVGMVPLI